MRLVTEDLWGIVFFGIAYNCWSYGFVLLNVLLPHNVPMLNLVNDINDFLELFLLMCE